MDKLKQYVDKFNQNDEEIIRQSIGNQDAYDWLKGRGDVQSYSTWIADAVHGILICRI